MSCFGGMKVGLPKFEAFFRKVLMGASVAKGTITHSNFVCNSFHNGIATQIAWSIAAVT